MDLAAALYLATASPAFAHHSHPLTYDWCKSITVEGRVESVEYKNPHSLIVVRQDDGTAYTVDWMALDGLTRNRILESAKGALAFGARVSVTGAPIPDGVLEGRFFGPRAVNVAVRSKGGGQAFAAVSGIMTGVCEG